MARVTACPVCGNAMGRSSVLCRACLGLVPADLKERMDREKRAGYVGSEWIGPHYRQRPGWVSAATAVINAARRERLSRTA